ncbi:MAG: rhomboid family intramembrane serine protease [Bauldia sp.]|nr:rhomboid family intramembrane serine protease [Bauldia sp.]
MDQTPTWIELREFPSRAEADQYAFMLVAVGISALVVLKPVSVGLLVPLAEFERARGEMRAYDEERGRSGRALPAGFRPGREGVTGLLAVWAILFFFHAATTQDAFGLDWRGIGAARAFAIEGGSWWQTITALSLHADAGHLLSNLAAGTLFGLLLAQVLGSGLTWLTVLLSGALGNLVNAYLQADSHASIGASTAVFGALGILSMLMLNQQRANWLRGFRRWAPLAGGIMLLAFLGVSGERTDIGAHFLGFAAGVAIGGAIALLGERVPRGRGAQAAYGAAALGLFALAWGLAFAARG